MADQARTRSEIRPVKESVEDELLAIPGVQGVDINEKTTDGKPTGELVIVVYVEEKKAKSKLKKGEEIPAEINGIPTDVQEEKIELQIAANAALNDLEPQVDTTKYPTMHGGISMGPCRSIFKEPPEVPNPGNYVFTGTFGAVVTDRSTGAKMALTNFHVACVDDGWSVGDTMAQPSRVDGGSCPSDKFGSLTRAVLNEDVDGAVVTIDTNKTVDCSIEEIGDVKGTTNPTVGMAVRKRGRTTELTYGTVNSTDVTVSIPYGDGLGTVTLKHQIRVAPDTSQNPRFSDKGDSGSVVVDGNNKVIGLLFAGTTSGSATYLNPIQKALDALDVDLCTKTYTIITKPVICEIIKTKPAFCLKTKTTVICNVVTKSYKICNIVTKPGFCPVLTAATCPPRTLACPIRTLACFDPGELDPGRFDPGRFDPGRFDPGRFDPGRFGPGRFDDSAQADEAVDDAFWLGYYAALEAMSEAEDEAGPAD